jgi:hypothetical protein
MSSRLEPAALLVAGWSRRPVPAASGTPNDLLDRDANLDLDRVLDSGDERARVTIAGRRMWEDLHMVFVIDVDACRQGWIVVRLAGIAFDRACIHGRRWRSQPTMPGYLKYTGGVFPSNSRNGAHPLDTSVDRLEPAHPTARVEQDHRCRVVRELRATPGPVTSSTHLLLPDQPVRIARRLAGRVSAVDGQP